jgi:hypothetical protein
MGILNTENHKSTFYLFIYGLFNDAVSSSDYITATHDTIRGTTHHHMTRGRINEDGRTVGSTAVSSTI